MKSCRLSVLTVLVACSLLQAQAQQLSRPKLVVGLMVDQMRWDYLYRFYDRYGENGFKRLMKEGFNCENTFIPYAQTVTAAGHASVYTGSVPAINGIVGNDWYDRSLGRNVYCVEDQGVKTIGGGPAAQPMSPKNMWTTTMTDELRIATNFQSKVIGIAIKDRGGILPAGHTANAAYWYDPGSGNWVTSTYYMPDLPNWVKSFNSTKIVDSLYKLDWNTLYPVNTYTQSDPDDKPYEGKFSYEPKPAFPHKLALLAGKNYSVISATPYGNTMTFEFAKTALLSEQMGADAITDFLALSLSSPDYVGHQYGPNSVEVEDVYLRLDKELGSFFDFLDSKVGKGQYTFFITADHAVAHVPGFLQEHKVPAASLPYAETDAEVAAEKHFNLKGIVEASENYQLYLNRRLIDSAKLNMSVVKQYLINELNKQPEILMAFDAEKTSETSLPLEVKEMFNKGYNTKLGGDIQIILKPAYFYGAKTGTTHGSWYPYDAHIPLLFMGWGVKQGKSFRQVTMADIAPTITALLKIQMPNGTVGKVITEAIKD
jgi:predicted AlkP superfamily pyrophosphatase or phosphodiesterase